MKSLNCIKLILIIILFGMSEALCADLEESKDGNLASEIMVNLIGNKVELYIDNGERINCKLINVTDTSVVVNNQGISTQIKINNIIKIKIKKREPIDAIRIVPIFFYASVLILATHFIIPFNR